MPFRRQRHDSSEGEGHSWFGLDRPFDSHYRVVTSGIVQPWVLFWIRLVIAVFCFVTEIVYLALYTKRFPFERYYIYFTQLTFIGITSYFIVATFHTGFFLVSLRQLKRGEIQEAPRYPLQKWGKFLQFLHLYLFSTIITFPVIVTVLYWALLAGSSSFYDTFFSWSNVSLHIFNAVFLLVEFIFGRVQLYWGYLILDLITMALYLGLAYLVHSIQGIWVYSFLDPAQGKGKVAAYIVAIPIAEIVVFLIVKGLIYLRDRFFPRGRGIRVLDGRLPAGVYHLK
ncbi:hypothetical protein CPB86DRAFT_818431 [Serendipita vermifera]|nr:hypothetical protein CPB86DRAFT_818431 [Serendipita vermifera]